MTFDEIITQLRCILDPDEVFDPYEMEMDIRERLEDMRVSSAYDEPYDEEIEVFEANEARRKTS